MILQTDFHIHSEASYDAATKVEDIVASTAIFGIHSYGLTDHVNLPSWLHYLELSKKLFTANKTEGFYFGVELNVITAEAAAYDRQHGSIDGFLAEHDYKQFSAYELPLTQQELDQSGVEYVLAAAHGIFAEAEEAAFLKDFHNKQMFLAQDPRVTIVGHPWWAPIEFKNKKGVTVRFTDFSLVPYSMHDEFAAAMLANGKYMEMNIGAFLTSASFPETFKRQYVEFVRYMYEKGVPLTLGTDQHGKTEPGGYLDLRSVAETYLRPLGFSKDCFSLPVPGRN